MFDKRKSPFLRITYNLRGQPWSLSATNKPWTVQYLPAILRWMLGTQRAGWILQELPKGLSDQAYQLVHHLSWIWNKILLTDREVEPVKKIIDFNWNSFQKYLSLPFLKDSKTSTLPFTLISTSITKDTLLTKLVDLCQVNSWTQFAYLPLRGPMKAQATRAQVAPNRWTTPLPAKSS